MCASHMYVCVCLPTNRERTHARLHTRTRARARAHTHTHTQFPSRMTIGMLLESMAGKSGAMHGMYQDATPFRWACVCVPVPVWCVVWNAVDVCIRLRHEIHTRTLTLTLTHTHTRPPIHSFNEKERAVDYFGEQLRAAGYSYYGSEPLYRCV